MLVERREQVIAIWLRSTGNGRNPMFSGRRQPSCGGTSRISREAYVRFCERLGVKFPGPTRQSHRIGRSRRSWRVRYASNSDPLGASQRSVAMCQTAHFLMAAANGAPAVCPFSAAASALSAS